MAYYDNGALRQPCFQQREQAARGGQIQRAGVFVQIQIIGGGKQGAGDGDALLLACG